MLNPELREVDMPGEEELHLLQRRLDNHIGQFKQHVVQQDRRWDQLMESQEETNGSIRELVACTAELHASTKDIVRAWDTTTSVVTAGGMVGRFVKWLSGFAVVGIIAQWVIEHFGG